MKRLAILLILLAAAQTALAAPPARERRASDVPWTSAAPLRAGEYVWTPDRAPDGPIVVVISLATQRATVYRAGVPIAVSTISSGSQGRETPTGVFPILEKRVMHHSNRYDNAPMPHMQRLTWTGVALHGGHLPGYPASHGCIRLPPAFARALFGVTRTGTTVIVTDRPDGPAPAPAARRARAPAGGYVWNPQLAADGPIAIVVSAADGRAVVLRGGAEIGSTPVAINGSVQGTHVYSLAATGTGSDWLRAGPRRRILVPEGFREALDGVVQPDTTVVVTAESLQAGTTRSTTEAEGS